MCKQLTGFYKTAIQCNM